MVEINIPYNFKENHFRKITAIIKTFSATIKYLRLLCCDDFSVPELLEILSLVPNVEVLILEDLDGLRNLTLSQKEIGEVTNNTDLHLLRMKKLTFRFPRVELLAVFNRLPVGVLTELTLSNVRLSTLTGLLKRQTNIKKLNLRFRVWDKDTIAADIFDNLKLESLELWFSYRYDLAMVLAKQTKLKSLKLYYANFNEEFMYFVENHLTELETFSMNIVQSPSDACIPNINNLKSLNDFSVSLYDLGVNELKSLAKLPESLITRLSIRNAHKLSFIQASAKYVPNLKIFKLDDCCISTRQLNAIMRIFNFVEVLEISGTSKIRPDFSDNSYLNVRDCFNPKLKKLTMTRLLSFNIPFLDRLIADYPNLNKLVINPIDLSSTEFRRILNGFTKLESLILTSLQLNQSEPQLTTDDLNYLKDHKNNLKFIKFDDLNVEVTDELKKQLRDTFDMVNYDGRRKLALVKGIPLSKQYLFYKMISTL